MPDFDNLIAFFENKKLIRADKFPVSNGDVLYATIESTHSDWRQGFCIDITGYCEIEGKMFKKGKGVRMLFWEDTAPNPLFLLFKK